ASSGAVAWSSVYLESNQRQPILRASSGDLGAPQVFYTDTAGLGTYHWYVSRWNGSAWTDLGGGSMEASAISTNERADFQIDNLGNSTVVWMVRTAFDPV